MHPVHGARERLDERGLPVGDGLGHRVRVGRRHRDVLGEAAGDRVPDGVPVLAEVPLAHAAEPTVPAIQRRVDRDARPFRKSRDARTKCYDLAGELVAGDDGVGCRRELAVGDVQVRAADAAGPDLDHDLTPPRRRVVYGATPDIPGLLYDRRFYGDFLST